MCSKFKNSKTEDKSEQWGKFKHKHQQVVSKEYM